MPGEFAKTCTAMAGKMKTLAPKLVFLGPYRSRNHVQDMAPNAMASWVMEPHKEIHFDLKGWKMMSVLQFNNATLQASLLTRWTDYE